MTCIGLVAVMRERITLRDHGEGRGTSGPAADALVLGKAASSSTSDREARRW